MALTTVRVRLAGEWTTLALNPASGRYEAVLYPPGSSANEPGGVYNLTAEVSLDSGRTVSADGTLFPSARLEVTDVAAPTITMAPLPLYTNNPRPTFTATAQDEEGGSGVDLDSFAVTLDGAAVTAGLSAEEGEGGATLSYTPASDLADGPHSVAFSVADRKGNTAYGAAALTVDTVPPEITLILPDSHRVVDDAVIRVAGSVWDATSGLAAVNIDANGSLIPTEVDGGVFSALAALEVGVNDITITAADAAGNEASITFQVMRLVTDRAQTDADRVLDMCRRGYANWTEEEKTWWANTPSRRGSYDAQDVNRVETAMDWIAQWLAKYGYACGYTPGGPWAEDDNMVRPDGAAYLLNVEAVRAAAPALPEDAPTTPGSFAELAGPQGVQRANDIEAILVAADAVRPRIDASPWLCGEILCGEF